MSTIRLPGTESPVQRQGWRSQRSRSMVQRRGWRSQSH